MVTTAKFNPHFMSLIIILFSDANSSFPFSLSGEVVRCYD